MHADGASKPATSSSSAVEPTLICYITAATKARQADDRVVDNLRYFVRHGLIDDERYHFAFVVTAGHIDLPDWARASARVRVLRLPGNQGFDFGNYRAVFQEPCSHQQKRCPFELQASFRRFRHFVLLPDTVRGPFLPAYVPHTRWPDLLTSMLTDDVKLVGPSINCWGCATYLGACRYQTHLDGHLLVTDQVGLHLIMRAWHPTTEKTKADAMEVAASVEVRGAGYNIAALQRFWVGHDFRNSVATQARCRQMRNYSVARASARTLRVPYYFDSGGASCRGCAWGIDLAAYEVMFVHHTISPGFEDGEAAAYSEMDSVLDELAALAPPPPPAGDATSGAAVVADTVARAWLKRAAEGYCDTTDEGTADCRTASKGTFGLSEEAARSWPRAAAHCLQQCTRCARCAFVSVSLFHRDCSWYAQCRLGALQGEEAGAVSNLRKELWRSGVALPSNEVGGRARQ